MGKDRDSSPTPKKSFRFNEVRSGDGFPCFDDARSYSLFVIWAHVSYFPSMYAVLGGTYTEELYLKLCEWASKGVIRGTHCPELGPQLTGEGWVKKCDSITFLITEVPEWANSQSEWLINRRESNEVEAEVRRLSAAGHRCTGVYERWPRALHWCKEEPCRKLKE
jgi:hypothetical protein